jgi:hypothetical protein
MSNDLVVSGAGALTVPATGGAVGEHIGDLSRDTGPGNTAPAPIAGPAQQVEIQRLRSEMLRDLVIDGMGQHEIDRYLPVVQDFAPAMSAAFKASNRQELARLGEGLRDKLVSAGLSLERIERIRSILQPYSEQSERALIGPGARNSALIDEMRELDSLMAQRESRYWKGPDADRLQHRWRELHGLGVRADGKRNTALAAARATPAASKEGNDKNVGSRGGSARYRDLARRCFEIEGWMSSGDVRYWKDADVQREYRDIIDEAETADDATRSTADADVVDRMREIESLMGKPNSEYYRGSNADALQREYRELVDQRERAQHNKEQ